jgi:hypothetical protein
MSKFSVQGKMREQGIGNRRQEAGGRRQGEYFFPITTVRAKHLENYFWQ